MKKGTILVLVQFSLILLIIYYGESNNIYRLIGVYSGIFIGLWAIISMKLKVSIFPEPNKNGKLTLSGPYKFIRHPMYTAVLLITLSLVTNIISALLWLLLLADLNIKMRYEERLLLNKFKNYENYREKTKMLVPYVY